MFISNYLHAQTGKIFLFASVFILLFSLTPARAAGEPDASFKVGIQKPGNETGNALIVQPDGKIIVGGNFSLANSESRIGVARFNPDGTLDAAFDAGDVAGGAVRAIALQPDGKILIAGRFTAINGIVRRGIARLEANGALDHSFSDFLPPVGNPNFSLNDLEIAPDNRIYAGGSFTLNFTGSNGQSFAGSNLVRLNTDGTLDFEFQIRGTGIVEDLAVQPDGRVVAVGLRYVKRFDVNGSNDNSFFNNNISSSNGAIPAYVRAVTVLENGKFVIGGDFNGVNNVPRKGIARLNSDGTLDANFDFVNNAVPTNYVFAIAQTRDGKIIAGGDTAVSNNVFRPAVFRYNADGTLDTSFSFNGGNAGAVYDVQLAPDGKVLITGAANNNNLFAGKVARLNSDGSFDAGFAARLGTTGAVYSVLALPDGKTLIGGDFTIVNGVARNNIARLNADGSLDAGFVGDIRGGAVFAMILSRGARQDSLYVGGTFNNVDGATHHPLARLNLDGVSDPAFNPTLPNSAVYSMALLPDEKIIVGGSFNKFNANDFIVALRIQPDGVIDNSFNAPRADRDVYALTRQPDGKILLGGRFNRINSDTRVAVARLNADGALDSGFNPLGASDYILAIGLQPDGKIVLGGNFTFVNGANRPYLARMNADGSLDASFTPSVNNFVRKILVQPDGKLLIGGAFTLVDNVPRVRFARLAASGRLDPLFDTGAGANGEIYDIAQQTDGKILIAGSFSRIGNQPQGSIARILTNSALCACIRAPFDFDGDGRADVSVWRPGNGAWYASRSSAGFGSAAFGQAGDRIVPSDFDGDGKADFAVLRNVSAERSVFYILQSKDNSYRFEQFGQPGDVPAVGDWDGDGKADLAVYRSAANAGVQGSFYYRPSSQPAVDFRPVPWGTAGDKPVAADFDADGRQDAAVWRPSNGVWYILNSSNNSFRAVQWGASGDVPAPADFDGDGKADVSVFRPGNGTWYRLNSLDGQYVAVQFGVAEDRPVAADYDGDGRADVAVFRPSNGTWYLLRSAQGFTAQQFGTAGDQPTPAAFLP